MAHLYKRGDTWWIKYYLHGEPVYRSLKTDNKRKAQRELQAIEAKLLEPHRMVKDEKNPPCDWFWVQYLEWAEGHIGQRTVERRKDFWNQLLKSTQARRLADVTSQSIERFKRERLAAGNSKSTINTALSSIKAIYNRAIKLGLYTGPNPVDGVETYTLTKILPHYHTEEELLHLLETAQAHDKEPLNRGVHSEWVVLLGGWAGLRYEEISVIRWDWFDFNNGKGNQPLICVRQIPGVFEPKDHEERDIPMCERIRDAFYRHRKKEGYVFVSTQPSQGRNRYRFDPRKALLSVLREAELTTKQPFNRLRHSYGSILVQRGVPLIEVSRYLGHSSVKVTEKHYIGHRVYHPGVNF